MNLGELAVKLKADLTNFTANMKVAVTTLNNFASKTATQMSRAAAAIRNFSTRAITSLNHFASRMVTYLKWASVAATAFIIKIGSAAEESENLFEVSFESMADSVRAWSEELADRLKVSAHSIRQYAGNFQLFLTGMEVGAERARDMSKALTELTYDISSLRNLRFDDALTKIKAALAGEVEPLRRLGITVNETTMKLWAQKQGLDANVEAWSEQQKVIARAGVILQGATKDMGDMQRTADSVTNLMRSLGDQVKELAISIYERWQPHLQKILSSLRDWVKANRDAIANIIGNITDDLATFAAWLGSDWSGALKGAFELMVETAKASLQAVIALFEHTFKYIAQNMPRWASEAAREWANGFTQALGQIDWWKVLKKPGLMQIGEIQRQIAEKMPGANAAELAQAYREIFADLGADYQRIMERGRTAVQGAQAAQPVAQTQEAFEQLGTEVESVEDKTLNLREAFEEAGRQGQAAASKWKAMWADASSSIAGSMETAFSDVVENANNATEALSNMFRNIGRAISGAVFQQYLLPVIFGGINKLGVPLQVPGARATTVQPGTYQSAEVGAGPAFQYGGVMPVYAQYGSFAPRGTDRIPTMISPGEAVLPERVTSILRKALGAGGGLEGGRVVNINVSAIDAQNTMQFLGQNKRMIAGMLERTIDANHSIRRRR